MLEPVPVPPPVRMLRDPVGEEEAAMPRPVILYSGAWADLTLDELAPKAAEWGYQGLELCSWCDHLEVQRALAEDDYCSSLLEQMGRHELTTVVVSSHRVSQAVCDPIDARHQALVPEYVWGDGDPEGVRQRAAEEVMATARTAQKLGAAVLAGFTGSSLWSYVVGYPAATAATIDAGLRDFAERWNPILDVCGECGLKFACEVHPGQIAFDIYSAERALEALDGREEFGFLLDPSHLHWQGIDPVEFLRRFPERICHVHLKDVVLTLSGRAGLLNGYLPTGDPRRGWEFRSPGHGGVDWEALIRGLNEIGYDGPLSVEWKDAGMDRDYGAEDACKFVKRLDFEPARRSTGGVFRDS
jgi:sugar phosphate isomerase/epimerase